MCFEKGFGVLGILESVACVARRCCSLLLAESQKKKTGGACLHTRHPRLTKQKNKSIVTLWNPQNAEASRCRIFTITTYSTFPSNLQNHTKNDATRANQKTNVPKSTGFAENLDGLEMRAKNVGRAGQQRNGTVESFIFFGWKSPCLGNALLHSTRSVSPPAFHSHRFPRFAPR